MSNRTKYLAAGAGAGLVLMIFAVWFFIFRDTAPEAVSLEGAVDAATSTTAAAGNDPTTTSTSVNAPASLDGVWTIDTSVGGGELDAGTFVGYRVQEELASIGAKTAVGRTPAVAGSVEISGSTVAAASFEADLTQLQSDSRNRDNAIRSQALETDAFPTATFTLTEPLDLGTTPVTGTPFSAQAMGDLTIHGVTRSVTVPIEGQLIGDSVVLVGAIPIEFADYDIDPPRAAVVLSVEDNGEMEFQLFLMKS